ncbi:hypothetical protein C8R43DRAFT_897117 [Mycena crocata]|nr:hypothetical protein C8R43DRAFT_897117 [Mycena crocata]
MLDQFTDVFLGFQRDCKQGVFGRVKHYYGVVEAQIRGSLHLHILIWLEGALSPKLLQEKVNENEEFKLRLFSWMESVRKILFGFKRPGTRPRTSQDQMVFMSSPLASDLKKCLMIRPPHPDDPDFDIVWGQFLREVLDASGQVHAHNETCFKKTPFSMTRLNDEDHNRLCRFKYPFELVPESFMDENGKITLKRLHARVVGHNPTISGSFQCNTDGKFVGSGAFGMVLVLYFTNYSTKTGLESAIVMSALAAAMKSLNPDSNSPITDDEERCRKLLLKTLNQINGHRELSGQQVASALLGIPNHVTDAHFASFYWSKLLSWLSPEDFPTYDKSNLSEGCVYNAFH